MNDSLLIVICNANAGCLRVGMLSSHDVGAPGNPEIAPGTIRNSALEYMGSDRPQ